MTDGYSIQLTKEADGPARLREEIASYFSLVVDSWILPNYTDFEQYQARELLHKQIDEAIVSIRNLSRPEKAKGDEGR